MTDGRERTARGGRGRCGGVIRTGGVAAGGCGRSQGAGGERAGTSGEGRSGVNCSLVGGRVGDCCVAVLIVTWV